VAFLPKEIGRASSGETIISYKDDNNMLFVSLEQKRAEQESAREWKNCRESLIRFRGKFSSSNFCVCCLRHFFMVNLVKEGKEKCGINFLWRSQFKLMLSTKYKMKVICLRRLQVNQIFSPADNAQ
jgi:hypothetical protein